MSVQNCGNTTPTAPAVGNGLVLYAPTDPIAFADEGLNPIHSGWKTVNLLLGGLTVVWSFPVFFLLSSAETTRWLSPEQRLIIKSRLVEGKGNSNEVHKYDWAQAKECLRDPQVCQHSRQRANEAFPGPAELAFLLLQVYAFCIFQFLLSFSNGGITTFGSLVCKSVNIHLSRTSRIPYMARDEQ